MIKQAVILAGGEGRRLKKVTNIAKPLVVVDGIPHICKLLSYLKLNRLERIIILVRSGEKAEYEKTIDKYTYNKNMPADVNVVEETNPKGTGGWIVHNLDKLDDCFLTVNADTVYTENIYRFIGHHTVLDTSMILINKKNPDRRDTGSVNIDKEGRVTSFEEKNSEMQSIYESAGIYLFRKRDFESMSFEKENISLEHSVLPKLVLNRSLGSGILRQTPHDYGTEERLSMTKSKLINFAPSWLFVDRDNTLTDDAEGYSHDYQLLRRIKILDPILRGYQDYGYFISIVTNQSGIGRGYFTVSQMNEYNLKLTDLLLKEGIFINNIEFCPHVPTDECKCRKPKTGMLEEVDKKYGINKETSIMIGDSEVDSLCAKNFGLDFLKFSQTNQR